MWLRRISAAAIALVVSLASSQSARSDDSGVFAGAIATAAVAALVCPAVALGVEHPEDTSEFERKGWLLNLAGTYAFETFRKSLRDDLRQVSATSLNVMVDNSLGVNGGFGYRCHRNLAVELEAEWISGFETEILDSGGSTIAKVEPDPLTVTTNFKGYLPLGRFQPFALAGAGIMSSSLSVTESTGTGVIESAQFRAFVLRLGGGVDYYATKNIVLNIGADYVLPLGGDIDLDHISLGWGVQYRF
jgi:opacity protein-like surface antigen